MEKQMSVKELSLFLGKHPDTIRKAARKVEGIRIAVNGIPQHFNRDEVEKISHHLYFHTGLPTAVIEAIKMTFSKPEGLPSENTKVEDRLDRMEKMIESIVAVTHQLVGMIPVNQPVAQIEHRPDYQTVIGYCNIKGIQVKRMEAILMGKEAARLSRETNTVINKIPDERFGQVNTYHVNILNQVFGV